MSSTRFRVLAACLFTAIAVLLGGSSSDAAKPAPPAPPPFRYRVVYLGTLPGATASVAKDINSWGDVVGESGAAFLYSATTGEMLDLNSVVDPLLNVRLFDADAINDNGQIVGPGNEPGVANSQFIFRLSPPAIPDGEWRFERTPLPGGGWARGLNVDGDVFFSNGSTCFIWPADVETPVELGDLNGRVAGLARGLTDRDTYGVVRFVNGDWSNAQSAKFAYEIGADAWTLEETSVGTLSGGRSSAFAINSAGDIAGAASVLKRNSVAWHAFRQGANSSTLLDLGTLGGTDSEARAINSAGDMIGNAETSQSTWGGGQYTTQFVYTGGKMYDLEQMVDRDSNGNLPNGLQGIAQINASKAICGPSAWGGNPSVQAFVLVPYTP